MRLNNDYLEESPSLRRTYTGASWINRNGAIIAEKMATMKRGGDRKSDQTSDRSTAAKACAWSLGDGPRLRSERRSGRRLKEPVGRWPLRLTVKSPWTPGAEAKTLPSDASQPYEAANCQNCQKAMRVHDAEPGQQESDV